MSKDKSSPSHGLSSTPSTPQPRYESNVHYGTIYLAVHAINAGLINLKTFLSLLYYLYYKTVIILYRTTVALQELVGKSQLFIFYIGIEIQRSCSL